MREKKDVFLTLKGKPRKVGAGLKADLGRAAILNFIDDLTDLHDRANRLGLLATGQVLHDAVRKVGYEFEALLLKGKITR